MRRRTIAEKNRTSSGTITFIRVCHLPGQPPERGRLIAGPSVVGCSLGRSGISAAKREGDGATPRGAFRILSLLYRPRPGGPPRSGIPPHPILRSSGWCDDPAARSYNRPIRLPFEAGHEQLWRQDGLYDLIVILDYNISPRRRGRGSAIFFHLQREDLGHTEGCVAIPAAAMRRLLPRIGKTSVMVIR